MITLFPALIRNEQAARSFKPDLILLDLIMPQLDGAEVAAQIQADWPLHGVPIVFVTGLVTRDEATNGQRIDGHRVATNVRR
jgi:CheY-like chemotaxis protein